MYLAYINYIPIIRDMANFSQSFWSRQHSLKRYGDENKEKEQQCEDSNRTPARVQSCNVVQRLGMAPSKEEKQQNPQPPGGRAGYQAQQHQGADCGPEETSRVPAKQDI